ncbi:hypothetical protein Bca52824_033065 [Brassica carinata]|uniref:Uncharacterized protein n=1 Tax=Brassica carinata TaxID=52824 RepID=A0A8X7SC59_BRACI|nr:hypothetical protein Bca52824_033065 [Brassica carinata]
MEHDEDLYHPNEHKEQLGRTWNKMDRAKKSCSKKAFIGKVEEQASLVYDWTPKDEPKTYYGGEAPRKLQLHQAYLEELQNPQLKQDLRNMIDQSLTAVMKKTQHNSAPRPASRDYELSCYQKEPVEKKEETAEKQGVREQAFESEPTTLCEADNLENHLKQEDRTSVICGHMPGQNQSEEGVLNGSPEAHELAVTTVVQEGMTLDNHGRPMRTVIGKEMDGRKLVGQEMEWVIQYDREMDCSNRYGREMSWKWKMKNHSWKWNMRRIFIIQMSLRRNLVGPGTRWIEPKKELFEKGFYRPKKWKDKPAWLMIGPRRLGTTIMVYFKCI